VIRLKRPYRAGKEFIYINSGLISQITRLKYAFSEKVESWVQTDIRGAGSLSDP
jgi:hypothetical protein